ncbi:MAG: phosphonate C-P lyase system protein PhnG [Alphaproteobacteria bacterium]|nr:phosphonate C-P lyase system protein PhnG [Alphaproteobacteria bacterium]
MTLERAATAAAEQESRQRWLSRLAKVDDAAFDAIWRQLEERLPPHRTLRHPEIGLAMVRGRTGGTGEAFNLGEMTVTRASIRFDSGTIGHGYVAGRKPERAERIALIDALFQENAALANAALPSLEAAIAGKRDDRARKAAATKVDFFTLVRGED